MNNLLFDEVKRNCKKLPCSALKQCFEEKKISYGSKLKALGTTNKLFS